MDVLSDWLREANARGLLLARTRFAAPWGIAIPASPECLFHVVTEGTCWLRRASDPVVLELRRGDYVLLPGGEAHELLDAPGSPSEPLPEFLARVSRGASFARNPCGAVLCGAYRAEHAEPLPLVRSLPALVHFSAEDLRRETALAAVIELLCQEVERPGPGTEALLPSLFDALLLYTLRAWGQRQCASQEQNGWMAALHDPAVAKGLERMHAEPGRPWTVESLAQAAGVSRAVFAKRFAEVLGEGPASYLTGWRMRLAARMLVGGRESMSQVARQLGYDSEFAFSRAFKRQIGQSPGAYRKQRRPNGAPGA
jgi:AraC-like DNA-binding protein